MSCFICNGFLKVQLFLFLITGIYLLNLNYTNSFISENVHYTRSKLIYRLLPYKKLLKDGKYDKEYGKLWSHDRYIPTIDSYNNLNDKCYVGIEAHIQLASPTKIFCNCPSTATAITSSDEEKSIEEMLYMKTRSLLLDKFRNVIKLLLNYNNNNEIYNNKLYFNDIGINFIDLIKKYNNINNLNSITENDSNKMYKDENKFKCPTCIGEVGSLPFISPICILYGIEACKVFNCKLNRSLKFGRKCYDYFDLPKCYQITSSNYPLCTNGIITLDDGTNVNIKQIHLEEDTAKRITESYDTTTDDINQTSSIVDSFPPEVQSNSFPLGVEPSSNYLPVNGNATPGDRGGSVVSDWTSSGIPVSDLRELEGEVNRRADGRMDLRWNGEWKETTSSQNDIRLDYNRCGIGLIEVVTEVQLLTIDQVVELCKKIAQIVIDNGITNGIMHKSNIRFDINISKPINGVKNIQILGIWGQMV